MTLSACSCVLILSFLFPMVEFVGVEKLVCEALCGGRMSIVVQDRDLNLKNVSI